MFTKVDIMSVFFLLAEIKKSLMSLFKGRGSQASAAASSSSEEIYPPSSGSSSSYFLEFALGKPTGGLAPP
jgi:hypothetical protein